MKKKATRLTLSKETLLALEQPELVQAQGAGPSPLQTGTRCNISLCICQ